MKDTGSTRREILAKQQAFIHNRGYFISNNGVHIECSCGYTLFTMEPNSQCLQCGKFLNKEK